MMKDQEVRKGVSNVVAVIAGIEIPRGRWLQIVVNLSKNTDNENILVKKTAIETIGFICETLGVRLPTKSDHDIFYREPNKKSRWRPQLIC